jgi:hypothetical protein
MKLEDLKAQWTEDCKIDDIELDQSSLEIPKLHAKYSDLLTTALMSKKNLELKYSLLLKQKWLWYSGKLDEDTIKKNGWSDDPFDGLKVLKQDFQIFFNADEDLQKMNAQVEYWNIVVDFLKRCLENITWRHQTIKNTIDWRKFMAGS